MLSETAGMKILEQEFGSRFAIANLNEPGGQEILKEPALSAMIFS